MSASMIPYDIDYPLDYPCYTFYSGFAVRCLKKFTQSKNDGDYIVGPVSCLSNTTHLLYLVYADADMSIFPLDCKAVSDARIPIPVADIMPYTTFKEQVEMILSGATMTVSWSNHEHHPEFAFSGTQCGRQGQLCEFAGRTIFGSPMFVGQCNYEPGIAYNCTQCERQGQHCVFNSQMNQTFCMPHGMISNWLTPYLVAPYHLFLHGFHTFMH